MGHFLALLGTPAATLGMSRALHGDQGLELGMRRRVLAPCRHSSWAGFPGGREWTLGRPWWLVAKSLWLRRGGASLLWTREGLTVKGFRLGGKSFCYHNLLESHL